MDIAALDKALAGIFKIFFEVDSYEEVKAIEEYFNIEKDYWDFLQREPYPLYVGFDRSRKRPVWTTNREYIRERGYLSYKASDTVLDPVYLALEQIRNEIR